MYTYICIHIKYIFFSGHISISISTISISIDKEISWSILLRYSCFAIPVVFML